MAATTTKPTKPEQKHPVTTVGRRLAKLMAHLKLNEKDFATSIGVDPSYVNRLLTGERGKDGATELLQGATERVHGIARRYWESAVDLEPNQCFTQPSLPQSGATQAGGSMGRMAGVQSFDPVKVELAQIAAEEDESPELVKALMLERAPDGATPGWWFRRYLALKATHAKGRRAAGT